MISKLIVLATYAAMAVLWYFFMPLPLVAFVIAAVGLVHFRREVKRLGSGK